MRTVTVRLLWFAVGLSVGVLLVTLKTQFALPAQPPVAGRIFLDTNVNDLISIRENDDAQTRRAELISFIWGSNGLPHEPPAKVQKAIEDKRYADLTNLKQIDRLTVNMEWGLTSTAY